MSDFGCLDMTFNVHEWVADGWVDELSEARLVDPAPAPPGASCVSRGSSRRRVNRDRAWVARERERRETTSLNRGFRVAR